VYSKLNDYLEQTFLSRDSLETTMFKLASGSGKDESKSKCYVTHGAMGHLDPNQTPAKRKPYSSILALPSIHKVIPIFKPMKTFW
jgi:hypothetical protein